MRKLSSFGKNNFTNISLETFFIITRISPYLPSKTYQVIEEYSAAKHGPIKATPAVFKCIKLFHKGDEFSRSQFIKENEDILTTRSKNKKSACEFVVNKSIKICKELGLLKQKIDAPISLQDFEKLETIQYMAKQLRGSKYKNKNIGHDNSTRRLYTLQLYYFNNWLYKKTFDFTITKQIDSDTFKRQKVPVTLIGIEHFLKLYQSSPNNDSDFIRVVKTFLMDEMHSKCSAKYMLQKHGAIQSYFEKNDTPLKFRYNPYNTHNDYKEENENATLTLSDLHKIISNANVLERTVVLCKFHRGLDSSTFADRFNFQVSEQLVKWFGTTDFENWNLEKCPVPIRLTRIKTNYLHTGYLDQDAILSIQEYLNYKHARYVFVNKRDGVDVNYLQDKSDFIEPGKPLFVNREGRPLTINWISRLVPRLARKAGIQQIIGKDTLHSRSEKNGHELRDLLKSTLLASGCADYVAELALGHKIGNSYEKQDKLYPEKSRSEYAKASSKINVFSNVSSYLENGNDIDAIKAQIRQEMQESFRESMENMLEKMLQKQRQEKEESEKRKKDILESLKKYRTQDSAKIIKDEFKRNKLAAIAKATDNQELLSILESI